MKENEEKGTSDFIFSLSERSAACKEMISTVWNTNSRFWYKVIFFSKLKWGHLNILSLNDSWKNRRENNWAAHLLWFKHWHANICSHTGAIESFQGDMLGIWMPKWPWVGPSHILDWQEEQKDHTDICPHLTVSDGKMIITEITNGARAGSTKADCWAEFRRYEICLFTAWTGSLPRRLLIILQVIKCKISEFRFNYKDRKRLHTNQTIRGQRNSDWALLHFYT